MNKAQTLAERLDNVGGWLGYEAAALLRTQDEALTMALDALDHSFMQDDKFDKMNAAKARIKEILNERY